MEAFPRTEYRGTCEVSIDSFSYGSYSWPVFLKEIKYKMLRNIRLNVIVNCSAHCGDCWMTAGPEILALKHESRILEQWSNHTGLNQCLRILLSCCKARNSGPDITSTMLVLMIGRSPHFSFEVWTALMGHPVISFEQNLHSFIYMRCATIFHKNAYI